VRAAVLLACLAIAGCGGQAASPGERAAVKEIVPAAEQIRCDPVDATLTRCHAVVGNALMGSTWTCELREYASRGSVAYSGSRSCWTSRD
jgi:hypothetical protein